MELTSTQKWVTGYTLHKTDGMWDPFKLRNKYRLVDVTFEWLLWVSHFEYLPFVSHSLRLSVPSINMLNESDSKCWISVLKLFSDFKYEAQWNVNASKKTPSFGIIRDSKNLIEMVKATIWYILKKSECTGNLSNTKRPSWRTTLHHLTKSKTLSRRFCITVKAYNQETCSWMEIQGFTTRCKASFTFQNRKIRLDFAKKPLKEPALCWKK